MELHCRALSFFQYVDVLNDKLVFFMLVQTCDLLKGVVLTLQRIFHGFLIFCSVAILISVSCV